MHSPTFLASAPALVSGLQGHLAAVIAAEEGISRVDHKRQASRRGVALITGGSSGIGLACVRRFLQDGWTAAVADLRTTPELAKLLGGASGGFWKADVRDVKRAQSVTRAVVRRWGSLDALVCCAGISRGAMLDRMTLQDWQAVLDVDLTGVFAYLLAATPVFARQQRGKVVAISSTLALRARHGLTAYVAAKAGVVGLVRAAARDLGRHGVNVNAVCPGLVNTPLTEPMPLDIKERLKAETCLGRIAEAEDVAAAVRFLCSEDARHITGETLRVDGGQLA